jgi:hypothetical protein
MVGMANRRAHLKKVFNGFVELIVQQSSVGDNNCGIERRLVLSFQPHKLVREPRDGIRFATPRGVFD